MAPKRSRVAAHDDAAFEAKRCRRLGQLVAEYGADENLIEPVEVVVDGVVHRMSAVLLAQSDVFRGMLTGGLREATQRRIELRDMSAACWAALRAYLQSGEVRVEESATAVEVLQAAHMYELPPLADAVEQRVADVCDEGECDEDALIDLLDLAESLEMAKLTASVARALIAVDPESERAAKALQTVPKASEILFADWQATEKVLASVAVGPLPGRYADGEKVYYTAGTLTIQEGYKITHGQAGEVKGPKPGDLTAHM